MAPTVDEYRDEIRLAVNRFERPDSMAFTKETLAALCESVNYDIDTNRLPPKAEMRAGVLWQIGFAEEINVDEVDRPFRKAELKAIANELTSSCA